MQRKSGREMERARIRVKYGEKYGEVILLNDLAFVIYDIDAKPRTLQKAKINSDGSLGPLENSTLEEFEASLIDAKFPHRVFIKEPIFEDLKNIFGRDVEVLLYS